MRKVIGIGETVLDIIFKNGKPIEAVPGGSSFNADYIFYKDHPHDQLEFATPEINPGDIVLSVRSSP